MAIRKLCIKCKKPEESKRGKVCQCNSPDWRYQMDVMDFSGKRLRENFKTKKAALEEEAAYIKGKAEGKSVLDKKKGLKTTFKELAGKYEAEIKHQPSYLSYKKQTLERLKGEFGEKKLSQITYYDLERYRTKRRETKTRRSMQPSASTLNKEVGVLTHMFNKAVEWEMIDRSPFDGKKTLRARENNRRLRYLSEAEIQRLLKECPKHLREIVEVCLHTGMRRGELFNLKWRDIAGGFIYITKTKTDDPRQIPINKTLAKVLKRIKLRQWRKGIQSEYVFTYRGQNISDTVKTAFGAAVKRAGILDFRFHDLRHTFASHYIMKGGSIAALQKILGHKGIKMTMRYAHLSNEFARNEIERLCDLTNVTQMSPDQDHTDAQCTRDTSKCLKSMERETGFEPATLSLEG